MSDLVNVCSAEGWHGAQPLPEHLQMLVQQNPNPCRGLGRGLIQVEVLLSYPVWQPLDGQVEASCRAQDEVLHIRGGLDTLVEQVQGVVLRQVLPACQLVCQCMVRRVQLVCYCH